MQRAVLAAFVLFAAVVLAVAATPPTPQDMPPLVEVWAPDAYQAGLAFEVHATCLGCEPKRWAWQIPAGCSAVKPSTTDRIQVRCTTGGPHFTITATAQGVRDATGQPVAGSAFVVVGTEAAGQIALPTCDTDGGKPQPVQVGIPSAGIYYRPGLASTGRLDMLTLDGRSVRVSPQCVEPKP